MSATVRDHDHLCVTHKVQVRALNNRITEEKKGTIKKGRLNGFFTPCVGTFSTTLY